MTTNNANTNAVNTRFSGRETVVEATIIKFDGNTPSFEQVTVTTEYARSENTAEKAIRAALNLDSSVMVKINKITNEKIERVELVPSRVVALAFGEYGTRDDAVDALSGCKDASNAAIVELPIYRYSGHVFGFHGDKAEHNLFAEYIAFESCIKYGKKAQRTEVANFAKNLYPSLHVVAIDFAMRNIVKDDNGNPATKFYVVDGVNVEDCKKSVKTAETVEEVTQA